ncbi:MAG: ABC transporter ATP-binding protein [Chloroflexota bacterium]|nr:ABC transporter ATP-binding protein [Chloroflexota bacterium]
MFHGRGDASGKNQNEQRGSVNRDLMRALGYLKQYKLLTFGAWVSLLVVTATQLVTPRLIQVIIDDGIAESNLQIVLSFSLAIVGVALVRGVFNFAQGYWSEKASQGVAFDLRNNLYAKLQSLSFSYHDQAQTGQLMTRTTNDVDLVRLWTGMGFVQLLNTILMIVGAAVILFLTNWKLALLSLITIPLVLLVISYFIKRAMPIFTRVQAKLAFLNTVLQENLAGVRVVKAFAREPYELKRFTDANLSLLDENLKGAAIMSRSFPLVFALANISTLIVIWVGGMQVIGGSLTLGELVAFNAYLTMLTFPVLMLGMIMGMLTRAGASAQRVFEILDAEVEVKEKADAVEMPPLQGHVAFEGVTFRYFGSGEDVLKGVDFAAAPGQMVALLGATGAGKSSVINLIPRFYDVTDGRVVIDDFDVRDVTLESLRSQIGIVLQETNLFSGTIRENIAFGCPDCSEEAIEQAAQAAAAHDFIAEFPDGYDTRVGERGVGLSGGQRQRIAIARALLMNPRILILDDSTSSVDLETEAKISAALDSLMQGAGSTRPTSFVIAQRISTVQNADMILVLDKGQVVAQGTHEELLRESPIYAEVYSLQFGRSDGLIAEIPVDGHNGKTPARHRPDGEPAEEETEVMAS